MTSTVVFGIIVSYFDDLHFGEIMKNFKLNLIKKILIVFGVIMIIVEIGLIISRSVKKQTLLTHHNIK